MLYDTMNSSEYTKKPIMREENCKPNNNPVNIGLQFLGKTEYQGQYKNTKMSSHPHKPK